MKNDKELLLLAKRFVEEAEANAANNPATPEIEIVVVEPQKKPYKKTIPNELEAFKKIVGGWIENLTIGTTETGANLAICLNEEGKLLQLALNRRLILNRPFATVDFLAGTFFITAYNMQGDNVSLTDAEAEKLIKKFTPIEVYI
jgi:hypothetical protein